MVPKDETIFAFLTDLKHQRNVRRRLFERADEAPEVILAYIDSLPSDWEISLDEAEVEDLFRLKKKALRALERQQKGYFFL